MSSLSDFLGEIGRHQLLTPEKELTMGRKVQEMVVLVIDVKVQGGRGQLVNIQMKRKEKSKLEKRLRMK